MPLIGWGDAGVSRSPETHPRDAIPSLLVPGRMSEISGGPSSGKATIALAACHRVLRDGQFAAWIDPRLGFYPLTLVEGAEPAGRFLRIEASSLTHAMKAADLVLRGGDASDVAQLRLLVLQLPPREHPSVSALIRLHRLVAHTGASLIVIDERPAEVASLAPVIHLRYVVRRAIDGALAITTLRGHRDGFPFEGDGSPWRLGRTV